MDKSLIEGYSVKLTLKTINPQEFMSLAIQACQQLGWQLQFVTEEGVAILYTQGSPISYQEEIRIYTVDDKAFISSRCVSEYLFSQQQNVNNILSFRSTLSVVHNHFLQRTNRIKLPVKSTVSEYAIDLKQGWGALIPSNKYLVTPILIYINVFILLLMTLTGINPINPTAGDLRNWGGNFGPMVIDGQYWRLFTYMFLHGGLAHIAGNTFALLYIGLYLEPLLGKARYLAAYLLTGIFAGLVSMLMHDHSVSVGASGAIFGMYGVFLSLLVARVITGAQRQTLLRSLLFFIVYNLLMGLQGNTDNSAHVGGLVSGMMIGYTFLGGLKKPQSKTKQNILITVLSCLTIAIAAGVILYYKAQAC
jgi:rhomboid protease GluP